MADAQRRSVAQGLHSAAESTGRAPSVAGHGQGGGPRGPWRNGLGRGPRAFAAGMALALSLGAAVEARADALSFEATPESVVLPDGPGSAPGMETNVRALQATGSLQLGVTLALPDGAVGPTPSLALQYDSRQGQGAWGQGWEMARPRVCRAQESVGQTWGELRDDDLLELRDLPDAGVLVPLGGGEWAPRWERSLWRARRAGQGEGLELVSPDGMVWRFGTRAESRMGAPLDGEARSATDGVVCWMLDVRTDTAGRAEVWTWRDVGGERLPDRVRWAAHGEGWREVRFGWAPRPDPVAGQVLGWRTWVDVRWAGAEFWSGVGDDGRRMWRWEVSWQDSSAGSLLMSVQQIAEDGSAWPAQRFAYSDAETTWGEDVIAEPVLGRVQDDGGSMLDLDGDALPDLLRSSAAGWQWFRNTGSLGWAESETVAGLDSLPAGGAWRVADVNGDGLRDVLVRRGADVAWYRNASSMAGVGFVYEGEIALGVDVPWDSASLQFVDLNGDRRMDVVYGAGGQLRVRLSNVPAVSGALNETRAGLGWGSDQALRQVEGAAGVDVPAGRSWWTDVDGDGRDDLVELSGTAGALSLRWRPLEGPGTLGASRAWTVPSEVFRSADPGAVRLVDMNHDGRADVVVQAGSALRWALGAPGAVSTTLVEQTLQGDGSPALLADLNGDGWVDPMVSAGEGQWRVLASSTAPTGALLVSHDNGVGGVRTFRWVSAGEMATEAAFGGTPWTTQVPIPLQLLREEVLEPGVGPQIVSRYTYGDPVWDAARNRWAGFAWARTQRVGDKDADAPDLTTEQVFYTGVGRELAGYGGLVGVDDAALAVAGIEVLAGQVRSEALVNSEGALIRQTLHHLRATPLGNGQTLVLQAGQLDILAEGLLAAPVPGTIARSRADVSVRAPDYGEAVQYVRTLVEHDTWGTEVLLHELGRVNADGTQLPGDERCTRTRPLHATDAWIHGPPVQVERLNGDCDEVVSADRYRYDGEPFVGLGEGEATRGWPTVHERWLASEDRWIPVVRRSFTAFGQVEVQRDALGHTREFGYDDRFGAYPVREEILLQQGQRAQSGGLERLSTTQEWDLDLGRTTALTDASGATTRLRWDGLGRELERVLPGDTLAQPSVQTFWAYGPGVSWYERAQLVDARTGERLHERTWYDGAGRQVATSRGRPGGPWLFAQYDVPGVTGQVALRYEPFVVQDDGWPATPPASARATRIGYDEAGRETLRVAADGARTEVFWGAGAEVRWDAADAGTDPLRQDTPQVVWRDGLGRTIGERATVRTGDGAARGDQLRYEWDALDRMTGLVQADGSRRTWRWDSLGRRVESVDSDSGTLQWFWDDTGKLTARENALGELMLFDWDAAGRLVRLQEQQPGERSARELGRYVYDVAVAPFPGRHTAGRVTARYEDGMTTHLDYTPRGQIARVFRVVDDRVYRQQFQFDGAGRSAATTFADGWTMTQRWNAVGEPLALSDVIDEVLYDERNLVRGRVFHDGVRENWRWDDRRRAVEHEVLRADGSTALSLAHSWDADSTLLATEDRSANPDAGPTHDVSFTYDALRRPIVAAYPWGALHYTYDAAGNLRERRIEADGNRPDWVPSTLSLTEVQLDTGADGTPAHRPASARGRSWSWDAAGRLDASTSADGDRSLEWDANDRLRAVTLEDGSVETYSWDASLVRLSVNHRNADGTLRARRHMLGGIEERIEDGQGVRMVRHLALGSGVVARAEVAGDAGVPIESFAEPETSAWRIDLAPAPATDDAPEMDGASIGGADAGGKPVLMLLAVAAFAWRLRRVLAPAARALALWLVVARLASGPLAGCAPDGTPSDLAPDRAEPEIGTVWYLHSSGLGTLVHTTEAGTGRDATVVSSPCGVQFSGAEAIGGPVYRFAGNERDTQTGYVPFGARSYDPAMGHWLSADLHPVVAPAATRDNVHRYAYAGYRWTSAVDLFGFDDWENDNVANRGATIGSAALGLYEAIESIGEAPGATPTLSPLGVVLTGTVAVTNTIEHYDARRDEISDPATRGIAGVTDSAFPTLVNVVSLVNPVTAVANAADTAVGLAAPGWQPSEVVSSGYELAVVTTIGVIQGDLTSATAVMEDRAAQGGAFAAADRLAEGIADTLNDGLFSMQLGSTIMREQLFGGD